LTPWGVQGSGAYGGDIDSILGFHNTIAAATDGTSNCIAVIEANGRTQAVYSADYSWGSYFVGSYPNGAYPGSSSTTSFTQSSCSGVGCANSNAPNGSTPGRWADPDNGSGVSGPPANRGQIINQNKTPTGGPASCPWTLTNCGPNDEPFSLHTGGCHALMGDGTVRFISENTSFLIIRNLCGRAEGYTVGDF
jgi:hypothetical protein